jgi:hypothetical protein
MLLKTYHEPKMPVGVVKSRAVPPPPSAPKSNAPTAPLPQEPVDNMNSVANSQPANASLSATNTPEIGPLTEGLKQNNPVKPNARAPLDTSPDTKDLLVSVDKAIAARKDERLDTPAGNYDLKVVNKAHVLDPIKPPRQRYRSTDQSPTAEIYM